MPDKPDRLTLSQFAGFLRRLGHPADQIEWPEDCADGEIDAVIGSFAIQHTSIDTLPDQRAQDNWFSRVTKGIENDFRGKMGVHLCLAMRFDDIQKGQDWHAMNMALRDWAAEQAAHFAFGATCGVQIKGLPFLIDVRKSEFLLDGIWFTRSAPVDSTLPERLRRTVRRPGKKSKLAALPKYRDNGKSTMLLLESCDIALMNDTIVAEAFTTAFPVWPSELDGLWFVHRLGPTDLNISDLRRGCSWIYDAKAEVITCENQCTAAVDYSAD
ncbi:MAG: hypothetical protein ABL907_09470 [Hyphomicrobium sp.]